jgi:NAD(P)-dependent dehydrogenase (short-subunit alcohol dehydrogenase family)
MSSPTKEAKVAIVTGGSRGIGRAIAVELAKEGWNVCISYLNNSAAAEETADLITQTGMRALILKANVASYEDTRRLFAESHKAFGRLDALVNNAGIVGGQRSIFDVNEEHLHGVFEANVLGSFYCASEAAKIMSTQKG